MDEERGSKSEPDNPEAAGRISTWLAARAFERKPDWHGLIGELRNGYKELSAIEFLKKDAEASAILKRIARTKTMSDLHCEVELLSLRVSKLLEKQAAAKGLPAPVTPSARRSSPLKPHSLGTHPALKNDDEPQRMFLRL